MVGLEGLKVIAKKFKAKIYLDAKQEYRWNIKSINGTIVGASSEGFVTRAGCLNNLGLVAKAIAEFMQEGK